jgi:hypothetical protein
VGGVGCPDQINAFANRLLLPVKVLDRDLSSRLLCSGGGWVETALIDRWMTASKPTNQPLTLSLSMA